RALGGGPCGRWRLAPLGGRLVAAPTPTAAPPPAPAPALSPLDGALVPGAPAPAPRAGPLDLRGRPRPGRHLDHRARPGRPARHAHRPDPPGPAPRRPSPTPSTSTVPLLLCRRRGGLRVRRALLRGDLRVAQEAEHPRFRADRRIPRRL